MNNICREIIFLVFKLIKFFCSSLLKPLQTSNTSDDPMSNGEKSNPIGKLQELTQKNWIRPPEYEFSDQENASTPNTKMYSCRAKVATYTAEG